MSRRERTEAFRIRRSVVAWVLALCVIVSCTSCSVHAMLTNAVLNGNAAAAQVGNTGTTSKKADRSAKDAKAAKSEKQSQQSSETKDAEVSAEETAEPQEDAVTKALREQSAALMDEQKSEILAKAQQTAQNSGNGVVQYHYCVVTKGEVGSVDDFSNAVFRIRTFHGRQLRFQYSARPSVEYADVLVDMFGTIQLPCGRQCDHQRRSLEFRHGRVDVGRWRPGAISHDGDQSRGRPPVGARRQRDDVRRLCRSSPYFWTVAWSTSIRSIRNYGSAERDCEIKLQNRQK